MIYQSEPGAPQIVKINQKCSFSVWDKWEVDSEIVRNVSDLEEYFKNKFDLVLTNIFFGSKIVLAENQLNHSKTLVLKDLLKKELSVKNFFN